MLRACGNHEDAEDVLIEALLKAYCSMDQLRDSASFRAWLAQIARRVCWQLKEHEALLPLLQLSELEEDGLDLRDKSAAPEEIAATAQIRQLLREAVTKLEPKFRNVYELRDIEEVSGEEVGARLGISAAGMKAGIARARPDPRQKNGGGLGGPEQPGR